MTLGNNASLEDSRTWLTGSRGEEVWARLGIRDRLVPNARVLNIGIGLGYCTRDLAALGVQVHAFDIAPSALARVLDIATAWNARDAERLPDNYFDLAMSHLVAQHMIDSELEQQIREVTRSLRLDGVFAMQFAHLGRDDQQLDTRLNAKAGAILRTPEKMQRLAAAAGAKLTRLEVDQEFSDYAMGWSIAHFQRES